MLVQSKPGTRCPKEGKPREYIGDNIPTEAPDSAYYRRLVADGSLIKVPAVIPVQTGIQEEKKGGKK
jgi:hypothetical protein